MVVSLQVTTIFYYQNLQHQSFAHPVIKFGSILSDKIDTEELAGV